MSFYSLTFLVGFSILFALYYLPLKGGKTWQNILLLVASYLFYAYANLHFLALLIGSTIFYFMLGKAVFSAKNEKVAGILSTLGVAAAIGLLLYFKYLNFFLSSFPNHPTLNILMPLGISFYLFRLISYILEIKRGRYEASKDILAFAVYVSFFPCIVAGPIDRPGFIKQLDSRRNFDYSISVDGCRQFLWGLFKKVVVADNIAPYVNGVWNGDIVSESGLKLIMLAVLYSFQMYFDFSGYSDMAIGIAKTLGLKVARNFRFPFFALNIADFWRRWHMSLTSWLTDYVFMPLNIRFRNAGNLGIIAAIIINFVLVGMWHGDNWTYAAFGLYHGILFIPLILSGTFNKKPKLKIYKCGLPHITDFCRMCLTFSLVTIGLVIFRADSLSRAFLYLKTSFNGNIHFFFERGLVISFFFITLAMIAEWIQRDKEHALDLSGIKNEVIKYSIYLAIIVVTLMFSTDGSSFIYAQF